MDMKKIAAEEALFFASRHRLEADLSDLEAANTVLDGYALNGTATGIELLAPSEKKMAPKSTSVQLPMGLKAKTLLRAFYAEQMGSIALSYVIFMFSRSPNGVPGKYREEIRKALVMLIHSAIEIEQSASRADPASRTFY